MKKIPFLSLFLALLLFLGGCSGAAGTPEESSAAPNEPAGTTPDAPVTQTPAEPDTEPVTDAATEPPASAALPAEYKIGTIAAKDGTDNTSNSTRLYNPSYIPIADAAGVTVNEGYQLTWLAYGENRKYLGNGNDYSGWWQDSGAAVMTADVLQFYPNAVYFRYAVKNLKGTAMTMSDVEKSGVTLVAAGNPVTAEKTISYTGTGISPAKTLTLSQLPFLPAGQDGAIFGDLLFRFGSKGTGKVVSLPDCAVVGAVSMDRTDLICPHSNSVSFGTKYYAAGDEFPLLYSNVYNTYASAADRRVGYCCVYRVTRSGSDFRAALVQIIRVGFADDLSLWASKPNKGDVRPYGNFVTDDKNDVLWAFVMRDADQTTRVYSFDLPDPRAGTADPALGNIPVVTLEEKDIRTRFDGGYSHYVQGATVLDGLIYSLEGFTDAKNNAAPAIRVFDTKTGAEAALVDLYANGFVTEPEFISVYRGTLYYSDSKGKLFALKFN